MARWIKDENRLLEPNEKPLSLRPPKGVDVRAIAKKHNMKVQTILRNALLEYLEKYELTA